MDPSSEFRFDGWTLRRQSGELLRDGTTIRLQEQPLQILEALLERPGELVTREQLIARLWPKGVVDFDTSLNAAVRRLRAALGDEADTPRYIETISRRGYRFIGTLVSPRALPDGVTSTRRWAWPAVAALVVAIGIGALVASVRDRDDAASLHGDSPSPAAPKSIAVLPFVDMSPGQDQQYFSDGLSEEVLNLLAQTPQLRVIARTSSFSFKGTNVDIATVAEKLNVTHVLEGSVRKSGDQVRVTAQLIDAATSSHVWSQTYDRALDDIFDVQTDIAASVANALRVALVEENKPGTARNAVAYERLLEAHFFFQRRAPGDVERARQHYQQALDIDPGFARGWAGLAGVYWIQTTTGVFPRDTGLEKVRDASEKALLLDPHLAEAHLRLANYLWSTGNSSAADEHQRKAAAFEPNNPLVLSFLAGTAASNGRFDRAIELQRQAVARDPLSVLNHGNLLSFLYFAGQIEAAKAERLKLRELSPTHERQLGALVLILDRQFDQVLDLIEDWPQGEDRAQCLALAYQGLRRQADADAALAKLIGTSRTSDPFRIAEVYAYRGEADESFKWLLAATAKYRDEGWLRSVRQLWTMRSSPFLRSLHADARWGAWVAANQ